MLQLDLQLTSEELQDARPPSVASIGAANRRSTRLLAALSPNSDSDGDRRTSEKSTSANASGSGPVPACSSSNSSERGLWAQTQHLRNRNRSLSNIIQICTC